MAQATLPIEPTSPASRRWARKAQEVYWVPRSSIPTQVPHLTRMPSIPKTCLNAAIHRIAVTQIRLDGLGQAYYRKKKAEDMSTAEALRCLKRRLARVVFSHLNSD